MKLSRVIESIQSLAPYSPISSLSVAPNTLWLPVAAKYCEDLLAGTGRITLDQLKSAQCPERQSRRAPL
jgi:hypothetical protein